MISKEPIEKERIRKIQSSFSWVDRLIITGGYLDNMSAAEILLYFFLVAVSDKNGVSFYGHNRICQLLKINSQNCSFAREGLIEKALIAYRDGVYQVLELPGSPVDPSPKAPPPREVGLKSIKEILKVLGEK